MAGRKKRRQKRLIENSEQIRDFIQLTSYNATKSYSTLRERVKSWELPDKSRKTVKKTLSFIDRRPIASFFAFLTILLLLIIAGSILRRTPSEKKVEKPIKTVEIFSIGESPKLTFQAQVEKTGLIKIVAQTPGIVQYINVTDGQAVEKGTILIGLANNYLGGNAATLQRQLAAAQYETTKNTFDAQKEILAQQRDVAQKSDLNQDALNQITRDSLESTQTLLNLNERIVATLNEQQKNLEATNVGGANDDALLSIRQMLAQMQAGTNQLRTSLQTARYNVDEDNSPAQLSNLQKEIALKQLDIQSKNLALSLETSRIQLSLAVVNEASFYPVAPFAGIIERVHVVPGQNINPGTELVTLHGSQALKIVAKIPDYIAKNISPVEQSKIFLPTKTLELAPSYISNEATDGQLYTAIFDIPEDYQNDVSNNGFITVDIPIGYPDTAASSPYIPLEAIYQAQDSSYVYINENGTVKAKNVSLGEVLGQFVEITKGLVKSDQVILDRTVVTGDKIKPAI